MKTKKTYNRPFLKAELFKVENYCALNCGDLQEIITHHSPLPIGTNAHVYIDGIADSSIDGTLEGIKSLKANNTGTSNAFDPADTSNIWYNPTTGKPEIRWAWWPSLLPNGVDSVTKEEGQGFLVARMTTGSDGKPHWAGYSSSDEEVRVQRS